MPTPCPHFAHTFELVGLAGLDPDKWVAVGIWKYFGEQEDRDDVFLYVADWDDFHAADVEAKESIPVRARFSWARLSVAERRTS